jgi:hypothetical protein
MRSSVQSVAAARRPCLATVLIVILLGLTPTPLAAHAKWFVEPTGPARPRVDWSLILSDRTAITLAVAAAALLVLYLAQRLLRDRHWPDLAVFDAMAQGAPTLLAVQAAITLVYAAARPALFVPNIPLPLNAFGFTVAIFEVFIAFTFVTGIGDGAGAIALILLWPVSMFRGSYFDTFDMFFWVGIGIAVLIVGRPASKVTRPRTWFRYKDSDWPARAVSALRISTGLAVIAPALSEKIWNPKLGAAFLAKYPHFNFIQSVFGLSWVSNDTFILMAGVVEATIGVLLVSGLLTRVVILAMWLPFNATIPFLPPEELIGHLPIFGIMYVLLVHGSGSAGAVAADDSALVSGTSSEGRIQQDRNLK